MVILESAVAHWVRVGSHNTSPAKPPCLSLSSGGWIGNESALFSLPCPIYLANFLSYSPFFVWPVPKPFCWGFLHHVPLAPGSLCDWLLALVVAGSLLPSNAHSWDSSSLQLCKVTGSRGQFSFVSQRWSTDHIPALNVHIFYHSRTSVRNQHLPHTVCECTWPHTTVYPINSSIFLRISILCVGYFASLKQSNPVQWTHQLDFVLWLFS